MSLGCLFAFNWLHSVSVYKKRWEISTPHCLFLKIIQIFNSVSFRPFLKKRYLLHYQFYSANTQGSSNNQTDEKNGTITLIIYQLQELFLIHRNNIETPEMVTNQLKLNSSIGQILATILYTVRGMAMWLLQKLRASICGYYCRQLPST